MTNKQLEYKYTGEPEYQPQIDTNNTELRGQKQYPYLPNAGLIQAVNLAIYLQRPLLLQGEPGCGKTLLASAIAHEFTIRFQAELASLELTEYPYFPWYIKSTTRAKEGLYTYDAVGRLRDAQLINADFLDNTEKQQKLKLLQDKDAYITWGVLGNAFQVEKLRPIVLIDEIDKADIDFPNDLLLELDKSEFKVTETKEIIKAKQTPIVIITSNSEKDLPDAFLRRCIYYYLDFPDQEQLIKIVNSHFPKTKHKTLVKTAVDKFLELRNTGNRRKDGKKASTSELIDLIRWLKKDYTDTEAAIKAINEIGQPENRHLLGILLKTKEDQEYYHNNHNQQS
ncbi:AAA family ATPase [Anabaena sp. CA = ATCC 33047]|uniref:AAA family ATPase n=1 Tax=Anabaena sp. (strain CA / ATCC 33047) TaxID=52271 RepID=UPI00082A3E14|nr:MoxR family ATPase [Anabaena sp. CA = ATCC 33047]